MAVIGNLVANLSMNTQKWSSGVRTAQSDLSRMTSTVTTKLATIGLAVEGLKSVGGLFAGLGGPIRLAGELEQANVAFRTLLGSAAEATQYIKDLQAFAAKTPFEFRDLIPAARRLMALGFEAKQVIPVLRVVGDATSALGLGAEGIDRITLALGQMKSKGSAQAQEFNQLAEAGIPAWKMLAKVLDVDVAEAMKMVENRQVSAAVAVNAILAGMQERFAGGMSAQAKTLLGIWSNIKDQVGLISTDIGIAIIRGLGIPTVGTELQSLLNDFRTNWMPTLTGVMQSGFGVIRASIGLVIADLRMMGRLLGIIIPADIQTLSKHLITFLTSAEVAMDRLGSIMEHKFSQIMFLITGDGGWGKRMMEAFGRIQGDFATKLLERLPGQLAQANPEQPLATLTDDKAERKKASSTEAAMRDTLALANTREAFQSIFANMRRADSESQKQMVKLQQDQVQETKRTNELLRGIERAGSLTIIGAPL